MGSFFSMEGEKMIPNWLIQRAHLTPDKKALSFNGETWTFEQLKDQAMTLARKLKANELNEGERVALLGFSNAEMVLIIHACMLAGLEIVMLNSRLTPKELDWQLDDSDAVAVIVADELQHLISNSSTRQLSFSTIRQSDEQSFQVQEIWSSDRTITIMYTSGTTGFPKGVRQTVGNHVSSALASVLNLGLSDDDVWLCFMPLFHISGYSILARSVLYGVEVKLYEKFDAVAAAEEIRTGSVTYMSAVSLMLEKTLRELEKGAAVAHPSFKAILAGGGPVPVGYLERASERKIPVLQTYGMTETSSQTATLSAEDAIRKMGSAGKPLFFNQIKIKNSQKAGEIGEVLLRGPHITPGYIGRFQEMNPFEEGWFPTGDLGYLDVEGYLYIVDRRSDLIISGGENIYPAEIENVLAGHPSVREVGVCGKEDAKWGSVPVAFVVISDDVTAEQLTDYCTERLARYKVPKEFYVVENLPRNGANKLVRRQLREWTGTQQ